MSEQRLYVHTKCCNAHWELCYENGDWFLECEKCGKPAGTMVKVEGPTLEGCQCEICKAEGVKPPSRH